jgi:SAM-dependent methyltransferase
MGAYMQMTPALRYTLGYGYVRGCYYGAPGRIDHKTVTSESGEVFECDVDHFDAEKHVYPYADESFDTVMCCELIEHLFEDPMHMMSEINRILKPGGHLVMTTPNAGSLRAISAILLGYHPAFFPAYIRPRKPDEEAEARHNREYVPMEIQHLLTDSGFELVRLETGEFREEPHPELGWVTHLLERYSLSHTLRGDGIYAVGRKTGPIRNRWPGWLYV